MRCASLRIAERQRARRFLRDRRTPSPNRTGDDTEATRVRPRRTPCDQASRAADGRSLRPSHQCGDPSGRSPSGDTPRSRLWNSDEWGRGAIVHGSRMTGGPAAAPLTKVTTPAATEKMSGTFKSRDGTPLVVSLDTFGETFRDSMSGLDPQASRHQSVDSTRSRELERRGGTGGGTPRARVTYPACLTRMTVRNAPASAVSDGPAWIRTRDQPIMSRLL